MADTEESKKSERLKIYMMNVTDECRTEGIAMNVIESDCD